MAPPTQSPATSTASAETSEPQPACPVEAARPELTQQAPVDEYLYLLGFPTLKRFLRFVRGHAVSPPDIGALTDAWRAAQSIVRTLENAEAGLADNPPIRKLGPEFEPLVVEFLNDPLVRCGFNTVPTEIAWVELDRLVVYQKHIDLTFAGQVEAKLGPSPEDAQVFRTCLPYDHPQPPVTWSRVHRNKFVFTSPSNDLRFLGMLPLQPQQLRDYPATGNLAGVVGLAVGFSSNFLNAIYAGQRLILNNGSHRAYALRAMGFIQVPCVIQHVSSREELEVVAPSEVLRDPDYYLKHPRPPLLKDYFHPQLHKILPVHRHLHQVTVRFEVEKDRVLAL